MSRLDQAFWSIRGVADRTIARLIAEMPEIGTVSNKAIAKLAGLAPIARDSGKQAGKPKKLARTTLARKLLVRLNAKACDVRNELAKAA